MTAVMLPALPMGTTTTARDTSYSKSWAIS